MAARLLLMSDGGSGSENADQALRPERADGASSLARTQRAQGVSETDGGPGSGNFGHKGRPGQIGGSGEGGSSESESSGADKPDERITDIRKFSQSALKQDPQFYGSESGVDAEIRRQYQKEMGLLFSSEGEPFDFAHKVDSMEEYAKLPFQDRVSSYVDYDVFKQYVLENTPWEACEAGSIGYTLQQYNRGATPTGYGKGKGQRMKFDEQTGLSKYIDSHPALHYNGGTLYRGIETSKAGLAEIKSSIKSGKPISMRGPSSWSVDEQVARGFTTQSLRATGRGNKVVFVDRGTRERNAIPFPFSMGGIGGNQQEVLYSGTAMFKPKSMTEKDGITYVEVESE